MKIYIDADACPVTIKNILVKAAIRTKCKLILVANKRIQPEANPLIQSIQVSQGADKADDYIAENVESIDLVITSDIPLAERVIHKGAAAINSRGEFLTKENIQQRLSIRNFLHDLRSSGIDTGGPKILTQKDIRHFANVLDRYLTKHKK